MEASELKQLWDEHQKVAGGDMKDTKALFAIITYIILFIMTEQDKRKEIDRDMRELKQMMATCVSNVTDIKESSAANKKALSKIFVTIVTGISIGVMIEGIKMIVSHIKF